MHYMMPVSLGTLLVLWSSHFEKLSYSVAARAIELNPKYAKAYYRCVLPGCPQGHPTAANSCVRSTRSRAMCHIQILKPQLAVADLKKVLALEPQNAQVRKELESIQRLVRKIEFEKAIEVEEEKSAAERCLEIIAEGASVSPCSLSWLIKVRTSPDKGACEVEKTYEGPKLETTDDGKYKITIEFIRSMIQWFKDGKKLPRRYAWEIVLGAHEHFVEEESLVDVKIEDDVTIDVIGDVHGANRSLCPGRFLTDNFTGQFYDVVHILSLTGEPSSEHILLMNGDLVDRGSWSVEVILTAFAFKC